MHNFESTSSEETKQLAERLAKKLQGGEVIVLTGQLGAGKTLFSQGLGRGLGIEENEIASPTFIIIEEYYEGRLPMYHMDLYRIESSVELFNLGYEEYFDGKGVAVIEWGELFAEALPEEYLQIKIDEIPGGRTITFAPVGEQYEKLTEELRES